MSGQGGHVEDPVDDALKLIQSKPEGILQSELWKELGVDSRKCSRIVKKLEENGLIDRVEFKKDGIKTYLLRARQQPVHPCNLLAGDELIPCIGCELECVVEECHPLMDWMYQWQLFSTQNNFFSFLFLTFFSLRADTADFRTTIYRSTIHLYQVFLTRFQPGDA